MKILQRIALFIQQQSIDISHVEEQVGLGKDYIKNNLASDGSVSAETLVQICEQYPDVNPIWLLTGIGEMLISDYQQIGKIDINSKDGIYRIIAGKDIEIELLKEHIKGLNELIQMKNNLIDEYKNR